MNTAKTTAGRVALVAGATRGAGRAIAVELPRSGVFVYATGRSSRVAGPSEIGRPETIEETGDAIAAVGGNGSALGGDRYAQWDKPLWEHDLAGGLRMLRMGVDTHLITSHYVLPLILRTAHEHGTTGLVIEMTDGTAEHNARASEYQNHRHTSPVALRPSLRTRILHVGRGR